MKALFEVFVGFLKLGFTGFGGPLALVAQMQRDFVDEKRWVDPEEFQTAFALIKSMPGAVAFNSAVYVGGKRAGFLGGVAAGFALIAPSFVFITAFASFYPVLSQSSAFDRIFDGMQAGALALILAALKPLTGRYFSSATFWALAAAAAGIFFADLIPEPVLIVGGGILVVLVKRHRASSAPASPAIGDPLILAGLFWICFKAGAFVFGSGLAIAPMLEKDFVQRLAWVTRDEFMDALAIGQVTPGPVLLTTTFLGHKVAGLPGAFTATIGVFLAGFIHMSTWFPRAVKSLARKKWIDDFTLGALAMVTGTIVTTVVILGKDWAGKPAIYLILAGVFVAAMRTKLPSWLLIILGGLAGLLL